MLKRIAVVEWEPEDGIAKALADELSGLEFEPVPFPCDGAIPAAVDMVLTFAPHGRLLPIAAQMARFGRRHRDRPVFVHWNTENPPDPRIPWTVVKRLGSLRSWADRLAPRSTRRGLERFTLVAEYQHACARGWIDVLADFSAIYARQHVRHGLPAVCVPWGTARTWHADLGLERDVDVVWFGKRRTRRRSALIDAIRRELRSHGIEMHVIDGVERPFVFAEERTRLLNRAKITLNLLTHAYESVLPVRFHMAAGNRCLVVSEAELDHHPRCVAGRHYVAAPAAEIAARVRHLLAHDGERAELTARAYELVTRELTMANSLRELVRVASEALARRAAS